LNGDPCAFIITLGRPGKPKATVPGVREAEIMATVTLDYDEAARSELPRVCMYCGRRATHAVRRKFKWYPPFVFSPIIRMLMTKTMYVGMPVCDSHGGFKLWNGPGLWGLRPTNMSAVSITLTGVSDEFADALYEYRHGREPVVLDDEDREQLRRRRVKEDEERAPIGSSGGGWTWVVVLAVVLVPVLICGGLATSFALLPRRPAPTSLFVIPTLPAPGQVAAREVRPEEVGLLAVTPDAGGLGSLPWPALTFNLRKEPMVLLSDAELDQLLADVKAAKGFTASTAEERLAKAYPAEHRREEVARTLEAAATNGDIVVRQNAVRALAVWATPDSVPTLIKVLDDKAAHVRAEAMTGLAALKDERGAAAVARRLTDFADRANARKALEAMGSVAEKPVADLLTHPDYLVRREACDILKTIGTPASVARLQAVADQDKSPPVKRAAQEALKAIAARP
jgi:hypothetical protein